MYKATVPFAQAIAYLFPVSFLTSISNLLINFEKPEISDFRKTLLTSAISPEVNLKLDHLISFFLQLSRQQIQQYQIYS